jgi:hypothetical protein
MSDDRFNFDDDLPDWLNSDDDADADDASGASDEQFDWQSGSETGDPPDPSRLGVTGELPWRQEASDPDDPRAPQQRDPSSLDDVDWDALGDGEDATDAAAELAPAEVPDWLLGMSDDDSPIETDESLPVAELSDDATIIDLEEEDDDFSSDAPVSEALPEPDLTEMPDWLLNADDDDETAMDDDDELFAEAFSSAVEEADDAVDEDSSLGLRRVASDNPQIRKLDDRGQVSPEDMTYEEWERYQQEQEQVAQRADEIDLESEVPDWFRDNVEIGDAERSLDSLLLPDMDDEPDMLSSAPESDEASSAATDANFVPEWFLGLEEQSLDESPDWVREATSSTDISGLTDTTAFELPPMDDIVPADSDEDAMPEMEAEPPDFFAMATPAEDVDREDEPEDFGAMFLEGDDDTQIDDVESDFNELVADDVDDLHAFDDLLFDQDAAEPEPAMPQPPSDADDDDWLADLTGDTGADDDMFLDEDFAAEPEWMRDAEPTLIDTDTAEDDLFASMMADEPASAGGLEDDWLGGVDFADVDDDDFLAPEDPEPAPATTAATAATTDDDDFFGPKQTGNLDDTLADILGDAPREDRSLARDDKERGVSAQQAETDISDLFEGVDEDFLEALSSTEPLGAVRDDESRLTGAALFEGPEWVDELRPDQQVRLSAGGVEIEFDQRALSALPENVRQLRSEAVDYVQSNDEQNAEETVIEEGTLAGISGGLSPLALAPPQEVILPVGATITEQQQKRIDMLDAALEVSREEIRAAEADDLSQAAAKPRRKTRRRVGTRKLDRLLVAVAMLVAVIVPFMNDSFHVSNDPDTSALNVQQAAVLATVAALEPGDRVLVAFEYGPTAVGELNPLAEAVLRDVLAQQAVPITLSTNPLGGLNGRYVLDSLATDTALLSALERDRLTAGEDYYTLRYLAGGPVAIRSLSRDATTASFVFSTDSSGENTGLNIGRVDADDFAMVLIIGETTDDIRNWAEQFDVDGLPKFALVTTGIEPIASSYTTTEPTTGFQGYLAGYRDTYRYNNLRNTALRATPPTSSDLDIPDTELSQWHSLALGALSAAGIIVLGVLFNLLRSLVRGRRS